MTSFTAPFSECFNDSDSVLLETVSSEVNERWMDVFVAMVVSLVPPDEAGNG